MPRDRWALRRALKDRDLYDTRRRVRLDLDEIAHPADIAQRKAEFRDWGSWYEDLAGIGATFKPKSILEIGVGLGYSGYCLCSGALLAGRQRVKYVGIDPEADTGPPTYGYRTLAIAAETFRRYLPEVRTVFRIGSMARQGWPTDLPPQNFQLVHANGEDSEEDMLADLRLGWQWLEPGGLLVASRLRGQRECGATEFFARLLGTREAFASQWVHNDQGMILFRKEAEEN